MTHNIKKLSIICATHHQHLALNLYSGYLDQLADELFALPTRPCPRAKLGRLLRHQ